jgi:hypothetical protein
MQYVSQDEMRRYLTTKSEDPAAIENGTADFYFNKITEVRPGFTLDIGPFTWKVI